MDCGERGRFAWAERRNGRSAARVHRAREEFREEGEDQFPSSGGQKERLRFVIVRSRISPAPRGLLRPEIEGEKKEKKSAFPSRVAMGGKPSLRSKKQKRKKIHIQSATQKEPARGEDQRVGRPSRTASPREWSRKKSSIVKTCLKKNENMEGGSATTDGCTTPH